MLFENKTSLFINNELTQTAERGNFSPETRPVEYPVVNLYPEVEFQQILGFGGAFTEAAGYVLSKMSGQKQKEIVDLYFGKDGLRYNFCRTHIDSCDFSLGNYSALTDGRDESLSSFTLSRDEKYILPFIAQAQKSSEQEIGLLLSPWSPPAFMKTNGEKNHGGKLKPEYRERWAAYICRYLKEYMSRGIRVAAVTVQNEPMATQTWDSCLFTAQEEAEFVKEYLHPEMKRSGLGAVDIIVWDHNKERAFERACDVFTKFGAEKYAAGVGVHWYSGDHFETLALIRQTYPDKKIIFTEGCVEYSKFAKDSALTNAQLYAHDMTGNFNAGLNAFIDWNMILDSECGPNHVGNFCEAPVMCDTGSDTYVSNLSLSYIGHFSKYVEKGARRIGHSKFTDRLEIASFKNPDGTVVMAVLNRTHEDIPFNLRMSGQIAGMMSSADSMMTVLLSQF